MIENKQFLKEESFYRSTYDQNSFPHKNIVQYLNNYNSSAK